MWKLFLFFGERERIEGATWANVARLCELWIFIFVFIYLFIFWFLFWRTESPLSVSDSSLCGGREWKDGNALGLLHHPFWFVSLLVLGIATSCTLGLKSQFLLFSILIAVKYLLWLFAFLQVRWYKIISKKMEKI